MTARLRISIRVLLLLVAACSLVAWLARPWLFPRPLVGHRFALIGRMDIDRDGKDDREDIKQMIRDAGGLVDYDLAPSGVETGKVSGLTAWYILDDRKTLRPETKDVKARNGNDGRAFLDKKTKAIKDARLVGVRPMSIERLLRKIGGR